MAIATDLHTQPGGWTGGEICGHDRRRTPQKGKGVALHPRIAHREQFRDSVLALRDQNFDWVSAVRRRLPFGLRTERHLTPPFGAFGAPLVDLRRHMPVIRGFLHLSIPLR